MKLSIVKAVCLATLTLAGPVFAQKGGDDAVSQQSKWKYSYPLVPPGVTPPTNPELTPREHVQEITADKAEYKIDMGGTMDGVNTRSPRGYTAWSQTFQPMRFVRLENTGEVDIVNPRLSVNGKRQWWSAKDIVDSALAAYGNPTSDADKVRAIWEYQIANRFHGSPNSPEGDDPVKMYNIFGYTLCNNESTILQDLYRLAGFKVRYAYPMGHAVSEVFYDGRWHLLDSDQNMLFLLPDNQTIAGDEDVARDHDLVKRVHSYSISRNDARDLDEFCASVYYYEGNRVGQYKSKISHTMAMTLRPGEAIEWRFARHSGKRFYGHGHDPGQTQGPAAGVRVYNGRWVYSPPLREPAKRRVESEANVAWSDQSPQRALRPAAPGQPAAVVWKIASPYVLCGGTVKATLHLGQGDTSDLAVSFDNGQTWKPVTTWKRADGSTTEMVADLDDLFPSRSKEPGVATRDIARYSYLLRLQMTAADPAAGLDAITIDNIIQHAPLSLPELELGSNTITYSDETPQPHQAKLTFNWVECSATRPPAPPASPISPEQGSTGEGTKVVFEWPAAVDPDGDAIVDYHFQLSDHPEMRWPLSPNFNKLSSNTVDESPTAYTTPYEGLLNPGQTYYWRVRALDKNGVWGPWSPTWTFTRNAPGVPLDVTLTPAGDNTVKLAWKPNPKGQPAERYEIYGSNEKGFTISREPYKVYTGNQKVPSLFNDTFTQFEPNLLQTVTEPEITLKPTKAFYRVVAVDAKGNRSGPTDFVAAPRPFIYTDPVTTATAGHAYEYKAQSIASIGDLRLLKNNAIGFFNAEKPVYTLLKAPDWLAIDKTTGVLTGTPPAAGTAEVSIEAAIEGQSQKHVQTFQINIKAGQ